MEGLEPPRISHLLPKQTRYQATVYTSLVEAKLVEMGSSELPSSRPFPSVCVCMLISDVVAQWFVGNRIRCEFADNAAFGKSASDAVPFVIIGTSVYLRRRISTMCRWSSGHLVVGTIVLSFCFRMFLRRIPNSPACTDVSNRTVESIHPHLKNKHTIHPTGFEPASGLRTTLRKE